MKYRQDILDLYRSSVLLRKASAALSDSFRTSSYITEEQAFLSEYHQDEPRRLEKERQIQKAYLPKLFGMIERVDTEGQ